jgi:hypothetical protein
MDIIMNVKNSKGMFLAFGYATLASLTITMVLQLGLFTPSTTPKLEHTSPQSIVRPSVLV